VTIIAINAEVLKDDTNYNSTRIINGLKIIENSYWNK